jgi:hypothetical protein
MPASPASHPIADRAAARPAMDWTARMVAGVLFLLCISLLGVAASLKPDHQGMGTHTQLGLAPCGFLQQTGMPCATCGMTTAYAHAANGNLIAAFTAQPAGAVFALITAIAALVSGYAMIMRLSLLPLLTALWRPRTILLLGVLVIAAWGYKIIVTQGT